MSGWTRIDIDGADGVVSAVDELREAGVPVPSALVIAFLRALVYLQRPIPNHRDLATWVGWGEKRVRLLLANEKRWRDAFIEEGHNEGTARAQRGHNEGTPDNGQTSLIPEAGHNEGTARAQRGHSKGDARDPSSTETGTETSRKPSGASKKATPSTVTDTKKQVTDAWAESWRLYGKTETYPWGGEPGFRKAMRHARTILQTTGEPIDTSRLGRSMLDFMRNDWRRERGDPPMFEDFTRDVAKWWIKTPPSSCMPMPGPTRPSALPPGTPPPAPKPPPVIPTAPHVNPSDYRPKPGKYPPLGPILKE